jgi:hypothetical protein
MVNVFLSPVLFARAPRGVPHALAALASLLAVTGCGAPFSTPPLHVQGQNILYIVTSAPNTSGDLAETVTALDRSHGEILWQRTDSDPAGGDASDTGIYLGEDQATSNGQGKTYKATLLALDASGALRWKKTLASASLSPLAATNDSVFVDYATVNGSNSLASSIEALRASDGSIRWTAPLTDPYCQVAVDTSSLYLVIYHGQNVDSATFTLIALNITDGKTRWRAPLASPPTSFFSSPAMDGKVIYETEEPFGLGNPPPGVIQAIRTSDGKLLWQVTPPESGTAHNVAVAAGMVCFYDNAVTGQNGLVGLRVSDGGLAWQQAPQSQVYPYYLVAAADGVLYAEEFGADLTHGAPSFTQSLPAYDASTGKTGFNHSFPSGFPLLISSNNGGLAAATPLVAGGVVYLFASGHPLQTPATGGSPAPQMAILALSARDGSLVWERALSGDLVSVELPSVA